jgi:hypothetical protein
MDLDLCLKMIRSSSQTLVQSIVAEEAMLTRVSNTTTTLRTG